MLIAEFHQSSLSNQHETLVLQPELFELVNLSHEEDVIFILLEAPLHGTITKEAQGNSYLFTEGK